MERKKKQLHKTESIANEQALARRMDKRSHRPRDLPIHYARILIKLNGAFDRSATH